MPEKILIIGIDGVPPKLINSLVKRGYLKNIKNLIEKGFYNTLKSTFPPITAPAWVSFATGCNPGKHGCYDFLKPVNSLANIKTINSQDIKCKTFYEILEKNNLKSILINLPVSTPPRTKNITIGSLLTQEKNFIYPSGLKNEIPELSQYRIAPDPKLALQDNFEKYAKHIRKLEKNRFNVAQKLFTRKPWNLFFILFSGTDWIQHKVFGKIMAGKIKENSNILKLYQDIDEYIGWFKSQAPKNTNIFIMSDHGFRVLDKAFFINSWLKKQGLLKESKQKNIISSTIFEKERDKAKNKRIRIRFDKIFGWVTKFPLLFKVFKFIYDKTKKIIPIESDLGTKIVDPQETVACSISSESMGIYINDKQRFRDGKVPSKKCGQVKKNLIKKLAKIKEKDKNIVDFVKTREELYWGPYLKQAPDILIQMKRHQIISRISSILFSPFHLDGHSSDGIFLSEGPDIKKASYSKPFSIIDLAPTILHLLKTDIPKGIDGNVLKNIFKKNTPPFKRKTRYSDKKIKRPTKSQKKPDNSEEIKDRLRSLGYLE